MDLKFEKEVEDIRGKIFFFSHRDRQVNLLEIKKGFSRGGHYHEFDSIHIVITGKIEYREENVDTKKEKTEVIGSSKIIFTPSRNAHIITALEDAIFLEVFDQKYHAIDYPKYRTIVEDKMNVFKK
jgi:dTDP-4-dehydrorhamnose 3,5-epimerase-like enzyme